MITSSLATEGISKSIQKKYYSNIIKFEQVPNDWLGTTKIGAISKNLGKDGQSQYLRRHCPGQTSFLFIQWLPIQFFNLKVFEKSIIKSSIYCFSKAPISKTEFADKDIFQVLSVFNSNFLFLKEKKEF